MQIANSLYPVNRCRNCRIHATILSGEASSVNGGRKRETVPGVASGKWRVAIPDSHYGTGLSNSMSRSLGRLGRVFQNPNQNISTGGTPFLTYAYTEKKN
jgi:hypothetical protein